jgi:branched-chain amino acid transport system permease protein
MEAYLVALASFTAIYVLLALGLNLQFGLTGLINFGHVGFACIGAYAAALLGRHGVPPVIAFMVAAALAALAAWPIGLISLKLREDYFAIVTLGFSEVVRVVATSEQWLTNGVQGLPGIPKLFGTVASPTVQPWRCWACCCWSIWARCWPCAASPALPSAGPSRRSATMRKPCAPLARTQPPTRSRSS